jgi:hypothetical protein
MTGGRAEEAVVEAARRAVHLETVLTAERDRHRALRSVQAAVGDRSAEPVELEVDAIDRRGWQLHRRRLQKWRRNRRVGGATRYRGEEHRPRDSGQHGSGE